MPRFVLITIGVLLAFTLRPAWGQSFDYYVLALSWSPTFCATPDGAREPDQCATGRRFAFVVHGLWPQYAKGWPQFCSTEERRVSDDIEAEMLPVMPSRQLVRHEWLKHGTCSGLSQRRYFATARALFAKIAIPARYRSPAAETSISPAELRQDFMDANPELEKDMIAIDCGNRRTTARLREVRVCFSLDGAPARCGLNERRQCEAERLILPPVR
jgi:ribonuclease T2